MDRLFDDDLDEIRRQLLSMGGIVEEMIFTAFRALTERDEEGALRVIATDRRVDRYQKDIDEACQLVLVRHQPAARDLRLLVASMKMVNEIERMGDCAVNIAHAANELSREPPLKPYVDLPRMAELVRKMVRKSLDSYVRKDVDLALEVCRSDDPVDSLYQQLLRELVTYMIEDPRNISRALQLLMISRDLERIADHATNIAEDVIFYVEARDIRHGELSEGVEESVS